MVIKCVGSGIGSAPSEGREPPIGEPPRGKVLTVGVFSITVGNVCPSLFLFHVLVPLSVFDGKSVKCEHEVIRAVGPSCNVRFVLC